MGHAPAIRVDRYQANRVANSLVRNCVEVIADHDQQQILAWVPLWTMTKNHIDRITPSKTYIYVLKGYPALSFQQMIFIRRPREVQWEHDRPESLQRIGARSSRYAVNAYSSTSACGAS